MKILWYFSNELIEPGFYYNITILNNNLNDGIILQLNDKEYNITNEEEQKRIALREEEANERRKKIEEKISLELKLKNEFREKGTKFEVATGRSTELIQEILISFNKNLIRYSLFEEIDKVRENSLKILIYLFANCTNIVKFFPFIFSALVDKLDCNDLEGYGNLPEDIRPTPSQNPHKIIKVNEQIEEIRILYIRRCKFEKEQKEEILKKVKDMKSRLEGILKAIQKI